MSRTGVTVGIIGLAVVAVALIVIIGGSGSSARGRVSGSFDWLRPAAPPAGWKVAHTAGGATFGYPPGWKPIKTDAGTASVALLGARGRIDSYLNATPEQGTETLANWSRFRPQHNSGEGARDERVIASTTDARFSSGRGSCVIDDYTTSKATYREIACLVTGPRSTAVVIGSDDIVVPTLNSYLLQQNLPNAELILFPDSNHGSHFQFTELFNRYLTDFVDLGADRQILVG